MTDDRLELTRRKILASMGAVGAAGAGAGLGTSALFSDAESFENNVMAAGELDLKVDWQQTYDGPNGTVPVNAYPDGDGDGIQSLGGVAYGYGQSETDATEIPGPCCDCADTEIYLEQGDESYCVTPIEGDQAVEEFYNYGFGGPNSGLERQNESFVFLYDDGSQLSLVFHHDKSERGRSSDTQVIVFSFPDGVPTLNTDVGTVQGGSYDGSDAILREENNDTFDTSKAKFQWGGPYSDGGIYTIEDEFGFTIDPDFEGASRIESWTFLSGDGPEEIELDTETPIGLYSECGFESGDDLPGDVYTSETRPEQDRLVDLRDVKPGDSGEITFSLHLCDNPGYVWLTASNFSERPGATPEPEPTPDEGELAENTMVRIWYDEDCDNVYDDGDGGSEQLIFGPGIGGYTGFDGEDPATLAEAMAVVDRNGGMIPLDGDPATDEMGWDDGATSDDRDCLAGESTMCVGVEWWVPRTVGNVIQGDEVSFDLGFYTEQCRNNDGSKDA